MSLLPSGTTQVEKWLTFQLQRCGLKASLWHFYKNNNYKIIIMRITAIFQYSELLAWRVLIQQFSALRQEVMSCRGDRTERAPPGKESRLWKLLPHDFILTVPLSEPCSSCRRGLSGQGGGAAQHYNAPAAVDAARPHSFIVFTKRCDSEVCFCYKYSNTICTDSFLNCLHVAHIFCL